MLHGTRFYALGEHPTNGRASPAVIDRSEGSGGVVSHSGRSPGPGSSTRPMSSPNCTTRRSLRDSESGRRCSPSVRVSPPVWRAPGVRRLRSLRPFVHRNPRSMRTSDSRDGIPSEFGARFESQVDAGVGQLLGGVVPAGGCGRFAWSGPEDRGGAVLVVEVGGLDAVTVMVDRHR